MRVRVIAISLFLSLSYCLDAQQKVTIDLSGILEPDYYFFGKPGVFYTNSNIIALGIQSPTDFGSDDPDLSLVIIVDESAPSDCIFKGELESNRGESSYFFEEFENELLAVARKSDSSFFNYFDEDFGLLKSDHIPALDGIRVYSTLSITGELYIYGLDWNESFNKPDLSLSRVVGGDIHKIDLLDHRWWKSQWRVGSRSQLHFESEQLIVPTLKTSEFEQWGLNNADVCLTFFDTSDFPQFEEKCFTTVQAVFPVEDEVNYLKLDTLDNHYYLTLTARDLIEVEGDIWSPTSRIYKFTKDFEYVQDWKIEDELAPLMEEAGIECIDNENLARRAYGNIYSSTTFDGRIIFRAQINCKGGAYEYYATLGQDGFGFFPFELTEAYAFTQLLTLKDGRLLEAGWGSDFQRFTFFTPSEFDHFADSLRSTIITSSHSSVQLQQEFWHSNGRLYFEHLVDIAFDEPVRFFNLQGQLLGVDYLNPTDRGLNLPDYEGLMIVHHPAFQIKWMRW